MDHGRGASLIGGDPGRGATAAPDGQAATLELAPDGAHDVLVELGDLGDGVGRDDDAVVAHEGDAWCRPAGARAVALTQFVDLPSQRQARVGVGHPQGIVAEELAHQLLALQVAGDRVGHDGVGVEHEALGQQRVEHQLHRRAAALGLGHAHLGRGAHDGVGCTREAGLFVLGATVEQQVEQGPGRERHEIVRLDDRERDAAGLDVDDAAVLDRRVAAAAARVLGVAAEAVGHGHRVTDGLVVGGQQAELCEIGHRGVPVAS